MEWGCLGPDGSPGRPWAISPLCWSHFPLPTSRAAARIKWEEGGNALCKHRPTPNTSGWGRGESRMVMASRCSWPGTLGQFSSRRDVYTMFPLWPGQLFSFQAEKESGKGREGRREGKWHPFSPSTSGPWRRAVSAGGSGSGWVGSRCHHQGRALTHDHS